MGDAAKAKGQTQPLTSNCITAASSISSYVVKFASGFVEVFGLMAAVIPLGIQSAVEYCLIRRYDGIAGKCVSGSEAVEGGARVQLASGVVEGSAGSMTAGTLPRVVLSTTDPLESTQEIIQRMLISLTNKEKFSVEMLEALALKRRSYVLSKIKSLLLRKAFLSLEEMLKELGMMLQVFPKYGPKLYGIFKIFTTLFKIKDVEKAKECFLELLNFLRLSYAATRINSTRETEAQIMTEIVNDENLLSQLLACFESEEENCHFSSVHFSLPDMGKLSSDTYVSILQNFLEKKYCLRLSRNSLGEISEVPGRFLVDKIGLICITVYENEERLSIRIWRHSRVKPLV